uniref:EF-hand domain-containing protein n=1 Tax=Pyrodinium bahamense TaxID=73915 RepID=A0A7R9ZZS7_9DINO|mmetsp:Transcript_16572/g.45564  ORF Transcript_16572/g.45564 Transcript_16572/m.45564 type:complete len:1199 (+) Transcript_16572:77-3673(+)
MRPPRRVAALLGPCLAFLPTLPSAAELAVPPCAHYDWGYKDPNIVEVNGGHTPSSSECQHKCLADSACQLFTWYNSNHGCWLYPAGMQLETLPGVISGPQQCTNPQEATAAVLLDSIGTTTWPLAPIVASLTAPYASTTTALSSLSTSPVTPSSSAAAAPLQPTTLQGALSISVTAVPPPLSSPPALPPPPLSAASCLLWYGNGCPKIRNRELCLSTRDGRPFQELKGKKTAGQPCVWCGGAVCHSGSASMCEPFDYALNGAGRAFLSFHAKLTYRIAACKDGKPQAATLDGFANYTPGALPTIAPEWWVPEKPTEEETSCLMDHWFGCYVIKDRDVCLGSKDGRERKEWRGLKIHGEPCVWCGGGPCQTNSTNLCEPFDFLMHGQGTAFLSFSAKTAFAVARCQDGRPVQPKALPGADALPVPAKGLLGSKGRGREGAPALHAVAAPSSKPSAAPALGRPATAGAAAVARAGQDCWYECGEKSGYCGWCGEGRACCRSEWAGSAEECLGARGHSASGHHECVTPVAAQTTTAPIVLQASEDTTVASTSTSALPPATTVTAQPVLPVSLPEATTGKTATLPAAPPADSMLAPAVPQAALPDTLTATTPASWPKAVTVATATPPPLPNALTPAPPDTTPAPQSEAKTIAKAAALPAVLPHAAAVAAPAVHGLSLPEGAAMPRGMLPASPLEAGTIAPNTLPASHPEATTIVPITLPPHLPEAGTIAPDKLPAPLPIATTIAPGKLQTTFGTVTLTASVPDAGTIAPAVHLPTMVAPATGATSIAPLPVLPSMPAVKLPEVPINPTASAAAPGRVVATTSSTARAPQRGAADAKSTALTTTAAAVPVAIATSLAATTAVFTGAPGVPAGDADITSAPTTPAAAVSVATTGASAATTAATTFPAGVAGAAGKAAYQEDDCWYKCGGRSGANCTFCGEGKACCRLAWALDPLECRGTTGFTSALYHQCIGIVQSAVAAGSPTADLSASTTAAAGLLIRGASAESDAGAFAQLAGNDTNSTNGIVPGMAAAESGTFWSWGGILLLILLCLCVPVAWAVLGTGRGKRRRPEDEEDSVGPDSCASLSPSELEMQAPLVQERQHQDEATAMFDLLDQNHDGVITQAEFARGMEGQSRTVLSAPITAYSPARAGVAMATRPLPASILPATVARAPNRMFIQHPSGAATSARALLDFRVQHQSSRLRA